MFRHLKPVRRTFRVGVYLPFALLMGAHLSAFGLDDTRAYGNPFLAGTGYNHSSWMSWIEDSTSISRLSIPATHDSDSYNTVPTANTQVLDLEQQLKVGIRSLDIRADLMCPLGGGTPFFKIGHGIIQFETTFTQAMDIVTDFLGTYDNDPANDTEFIFMRFVDNEYGTCGLLYDDGSEEYRTLFRETFEAHINVAEWKDHVWQEGIGKSVPRVPTLGEVRGKIIFLTGNPLNQNLKNPEPDHNEYWGYQYGKYPVRDQDKFEVSPFCIGNDPFPAREYCVDDKVISVLNYIEKASNEPPVAGS